MYEKVTKHSVQKYPQGQSGFTLPYSWYIDASQVIAPVRKMLMQQHKPLWCATLAFPVLQRSYKKAIYLERLIRGILLI